MEDVVFLIIETPNGKHRLRQRSKEFGQLLEHDHGLYDTDELARAAIGRILKPKTTYFNKEGVQLPDVPANQN